MTTRAQEREEKRKELKAFLVELAKDGWECYYSDSQFYVNSFVAKGVCIMSISHHEMEGWRYSLNYVPDGGKGTGCRCNDIESRDLSLETLIEHYYGCVSFARSLNAITYKSQEAGVNWMLKMFGKSSNYKKVEVE